MLIGRLVDKKATVHLHNGILLSDENEGNLTLCYSMDGPGKHCSEKDIPFDFTHMWTLMNELH